MATFICIGSDRKVKRRLYSKETEIAANNTEAGNDQSTHGYEDAITNTSYKTVNEQNELTTTANAGR